MNLKSIEDLKIKSIFSISLVGLGPKQSRQPSQQP
jgi:hypothetical protein